jgi:hypothetical protein
MGYKDSVAHGFYASELWSHSQRTLNAPRDQAAVGPSDTQPG